MAKVHWAEKIAQYDGLDPMGRPLCCNAWCPIGDMNTTISVVTERADRVTCKRCLAAMRKESK